MELSATRRKLLFVVIVVVLAVLGYYLVLPAMQHKNSTIASPPTTASPSTDPATSLATVAPAVTQSPATGSVNIYNWLPFTEQNLEAAADVATQFCVDYDTYTYTESASAYTSKMSALIDPESGLQAALQNAYVEPGLASLRTKQKWISSATASVNQLRAFSSQSLTLVMTITQRLVSTKGTTNGGNQYAVTLTGSGSNWQVYDIELASDGNT
jgi:spermidine/putrescine-binding protein